jgi:hypothetical protein
MWNRFRDRSTQNIGFMDRVIRSVIAVVVFALVVFQVITGWVIVVPALVAIYLIVTGNIGSCPLYKVFGYSTNRY